MRTRLMTPTAPPTLEPSPASTRRHFINSHPYRQLAVGIVGPGSGAKSHQKVPLRDIFTSSKRHLSRSRAKTSLGKLRIFRQCPQLALCSRIGEKKSGVSVLVFALWRHEGDHHQKTEIGEKHQNVQTWCAWPSESIKVRRLNFFGFF